MQYKIRTNKFLTDQTDKSDKKQIILIQNYKNLKFIVIFSLLYTKKKNVNISIIKEEEIKGDEGGRKRKGTQKSNHHDQLLQFQDVPLFPYPSWSVPLHLQPPRSTHSTLAPHGGSYPGESITDEGAHQRVQWRGKGSQVVELGVARGAVELGSASGTRPARDRRRHRRASLVSLRLASPPHHRRRCRLQRPPPLTWIFCSPRCLFLSLFFQRVVSFFHFRMDVPESLLLVLLDNKVTFHIFILLDRLN